MLVEEGEGEKRERGRPCQVSGRSQTKKGKEKDAREQSRSEGRKYLGVEGVMGDVAGGCLSVRESGQELVGGGGQREGK